MSPPKVTSQKKQSWISTPGLHPEAHSLPSFCPTQTLSQRYGPQLPLPGESNPGRGREHLTWLWRRAQRGTWGHLLAWPTVSSGQRSQDGAICLFLWILQPEIAQSTGLGPQRLGAQESSSNKPLVPFLCGSWPWSPPEGVA